MTPFAQFQQKRSNALSSSKPTTSVLPPSRAFALPASAPALDHSPSPTWRTAVEHAARFGYSIARLAIHSPVGTLDMTTVQEHSAPTEQRANNENGAFALQRYVQPMERTEAEDVTSVGPKEHEGNEAGLPDTLKVGIESLSGMSMDDVHVHYNSSEPAQVQALAYTQGMDIYVGPGQQKYLQHEAWHVVQQKQGRVKPTLQAQGIAMNDDQGLEREADVMGEMALQMKARADASLLLTSSVTGKVAQFWRATAIDNATRPNNNQALRTFIDANDLAKEDEDDNNTLEGLTAFNTLHHIISKDTLANKLAPALKNGYNSANHNIRAAAGAFLEKVKETADFHEDILEQANVPQETQFTRLLQNLPLNFELGYTHPVGNAGTDFDPQVVRGDTTNGITDYTIDPLSEILQELHGMLTNLPDNPSADKWNAMTDILDRAGAVYAEREKMGTYLMKPNLEQWDTYGGEAQKKTPGQYIDDVQAAFSHAANSYATTRDKEDVAAIEEEWREDINGFLIENDFSGENITFKDLNFSVHLRHIAARHTMKFFQFETTSENTFFPDIASVEELKLKIRHVINDVIKPAIQAHIENFSDENSWPELRIKGVKDGYYMDFEMVTESTESEEGEEERVNLTVNTIAPQTGAIFVTKPKIEEFLANKQAQGE